MEGITKVEIELTERNTWAVRLTKEYAPEHGGGNQTFHFEEQRTIEDAMCLATGGIVHSKSAPFHLEGRITQAGSGHETWRPFQ